eukprot:CAMPEP_0177166686 /NCGR_PEP_ID=MMETSP0367-20130122/8159_1 /TAXON_ID=447022 ORGANISM="Scrippsiella hangoei-like, Strain SHHI-4" /NCGR_SAMPLE_ID=MMETSP0367 /ASSEMBLY_ACC=CAM_ASM_000362 /LENGTH=138 /DNA_ID=CAMNT_0018612757 /DNA_START=18 /DNA_END=434 /DNA_ORIENTATION=-
MTPEEGERPDLDRDAIIKEAEKHGMEPAKGSGGKVRICGQDEGGDEKCAPLAGGAPGGVCPFALRGPASGKPRRVEVARIPGVGAGLRRGGNPQFDLDRRRGPRDHGRKGFGPQARFCHGQDRATSGRTADIVHAIFS